MNLKISFNFFLLNLLFVLASSNIDNVNHIVDNEIMTNYIKMNEKMEFLHQELAKLKGELHQLKECEEKFPLVDSVQNKLKEDAKQMRENIDELKENDVFTEILINENRQELLRLQTEVKRLNASLEAKRKHDDSSHRHSINLNERLEAEHFDFEQQVASQNACPTPTDATVRRSYITPRVKNAVVGYYRVNFGLGPRMVQLHVASGVNLETTGNIQFRLNSPNNSPFVSVPIRSTLSPCEFVTINSFLPTSPKGIQNLYLTFDTTFNGPLVNIDWLLFK